MRSKLKCLLAVPHLYVRSVRMSVRSVRMSVRLSIHIERMLAIAAMSFHRLFSFGMFSVKVSTKIYLACHIVELLDMPYELYSIGHFHSQPYICPMIHI
jgi:hypothetical protein